MTQQALKLALEWAEAHGEIVFAGGGMDAVNKMNSWATAIKEALAQTELCKYGQEPKSCTSSPMDCQCAIDAALAQPEQDHIPDARKMVTEQEPVAHCEAGPEYCPVCNTELNQEPAIYPEEAYEMGLEEIAFYTAPPQPQPVAYWKEHAQGLQRDYDSLLADFQAQRSESSGKPSAWVELTNGELTDLFYNTNLGQRSAVAQAIALLKEKNT
jgi:hypothetical protein